MHIVPPDGYATRHRFGIGCPCHPHLELREEDNGQIAWVFIHRRLDRQEKTK